MTDYSKTTNFTAKDALNSGDAAKLIKGALFDTEFDAIVVASATKHDSGDIASQAEAQTGTSNTKLMTPLRTEEWGATWEAENLGLVGDLRALSSDPSADRIIFFDDTDNTVKFLTPGDGIEISGTTLQLPAALAGAGLTLSSGVLTVGADEGVKIESDTVRLVDVAAGAAQPVVVANGTFTFDLSSITEITAAGLSQAADGYLINDAGTLKVMPYDNSGLIIVTLDADQTFAFADANTMQVLTGNTNRVWTIPPNSGEAFTIGSAIIVQNSGTGDLTITAGVGVILDSIFHAAGATAQSDRVRDGGRGVLIKTAINTWSFGGDVFDS